MQQIMDGNGRLAQGKDETRKIWKEYLEDLYIIDTQEEVAVHMCGFDGIQRGNYLEESQLEELRLRCKWASSRMERLLERVRSQEK